MNSKRKQSIKSIIAMKGGYDIMMGAMAFLFSEIFVQTTVIFADAYKLITEKEINTPALNTYIWVCVSALLLIGVALFVSGLRKRYFQFDVRECIRLNAREGFRNGGNMAVIIIIQAVALISVLHSTSDMGFKTINGLIDALAKGETKVEPNMVGQLAFAVSGATSLVQVALTMAVNLLKKQAIYLLFASTAHCAAFFAMKYDIARIREELKVPRLRIISYKNAKKEEVEQFYAENDREEITTRVSRLNSWNGDYRIWLNCVESAYETAQAFDYATPFVFFVKEKGSDAIVGSISIRWFKRPQEGPSGFHAIIDLLPAKHNDVNLRILIKAVNRRARSHYVNTAYFYTDTDNVAFKSAAADCGLQKLDTNDCSDMHTWLGVVSSKYDSLI